MTNAERLRRFRQAVQMADSALYSKVAAHGLEAANLSLKDLEEMFRISLRGKLNKLSKNKEN
jgi:hypothetical protein